MIAVLCILWASAYGCTACMVSSAASVGGGAADAGVTHFHMGKVARFEVARYEDVIEASRRATEHLSLDLKKEKLEEDQGSFTYLDDKNQKIDLLIERRTETITYIEVDVGILGPKGLGLLVLNQILIELTGHGA